MPEEIAKPGEADAALDEAFMRQVTWKPSVMRNIAIRIAARAISEGDRIFWADDIDFDFVEAADRNCIGGAWRQLVKAGIVKRTDLNRRSIKKASKGRTVFKYRLVSATRAETFLKRNGWTGNITSKGEKLLFAVEEMRGGK